MIAVHFFGRYSSLPLESFVILLFVIINVACVTRENNLRYKEIPQRIYILLEKLKGMCDLRSLAIEWLVAISSCATQLMQLKQQNLHSL
jgi:hypothetical protein